MKKLIVFAIVIICIGIMYIMPHSILSPGELVEGHQKLNNDCFACHKAFWGIDKDKCIGCHKLSEIGNDTSLTHDSLANKGKILFHQNFKNQDCSICHADHKGLKPLIVNDFNHKILNATVIKNCIACHKKPNDNLHVQLSASCSDCHNTQGWKNSVVFNHDVLKDVDKNNCISCHKKPTNSSHSIFKDNCDKCHTTSKWVPSTFDHSSHFQLDEHHNAKCDVCHTNNNFSGYTCYGCHEHSENNISNKHNKHGINNFTDCVKCHKSGNEREEGEHGNSTDGEEHSED